MKMPLFGAGLQARSAHITAQTRVNIYAEMQPADEKTKVAFYGTPGLEAPFVQLGDTPIRGQWAVRDFNYVVHRGLLWKIANNGTRTNVGTFGTTSGRVDMADNGDQILICDGSAVGYLYTIATNTLVQISSPGFPAGATTCAWQDGYFLVTDGNLWGVSTLDNGLLWNALMFAQAEANPDDIVRIYADHGEVLLFGQYTTEFWANTGALDFPYSRLGGGVVEWGLAAKWSIAKFSSSIMFLGQNRMGQVQVVLLNGYTPAPVSTPEIDYLLNNYSAFSNATAFSYMHFGHPFYQISFPSANKTWLFDGLTKIWSELVYNGTSRHRAETAVNFLGRIVVSDYENGNLYRVNPEVYTDNGVQIIRKLRSRHLEGQDGELFALDRIWLDFAPGQGLIGGQGSLPQAMLRVSKDGGHSYSSERFAPIGAQGRYLNRCVWRRLGRARNWTFEVSVSDPVKFSLTGEGWL